MSFYRYRQLVAASLKRDRNYSERDILRKEQFVAMNNRLTMYLFDMKMRTNLFVSYDEDPVWLMDYFDDTMFNTQLINIIQMKLKEVPLEERCNHIERVCKKLTKTEILKAFGYTECTVQQLDDKLIKDCLEKDPVVKPNIHQSIKAHNNVPDVHGCVIIDGPEVLETYPKKMLPTFIFDKGERPVNVSGYSESRTITNDPRDAPTLKIKQEAEYIKEIEYDFSKSDIVTHSVYGLSQKFLQTDAKSFPLLVYACPGSGKSYLNKIGRCFLDTDNLFFWPMINQVPNIITNMPHLIKTAKHSISVIPTLAVFRSRCEKIQGFSDDWYYGMLEETKTSNIRILTNKRLNEISYLRGLFSNPS